MARKDSTARSGKLGTGSVEDPQVMEQSVHKILAHKQKTVLIPAGH
jgi:hypothetical protein